MKRDMTHGTPNPTRPRRRHARCIAREAECNRAAPATVVLSANHRDRARSTSLVVEPPAGARMRASSVDSTTISVTFELPAPATHDVYLMATAEPPALWLHPAQGQFLAVLEGEQRVTFEMNACLVTTPTTTVLTVTDGEHTSSATIQLLPPAGNYLASCGWNRCTRTRRRSGSR